MIYLITRNGHVQYDENAGFVVRAKDELEARTIGNANCTDEGKIWTDIVKVSCIEIKPDGESEIILRDFNAG